MFFATSLAVRAAFIVTLVYHHFGKLVQGTARDGCANSETLKPLHCSRSHSHSRRLTPAPNPQPAHPKPQPPGPGGHDAMLTGDAAHRNPMMALFYAGYTTDLLQLLRRPQEFARSFRSFMVPHHLLSFAWFTPWMVFLAPRGAEGAAIWNTTFVYLCAAVPNHSYKLLGCWFKPRWYGWLVGPSICAHWLVLLASQRYYFSQCACSAWGCWYPGSVMMLVGAWGMAVWDVPSFLDSIVYSNS